MFFIGVDAFGQVWWRYWDTGGRLLLSSVRSETRVFKDQFFEQALGGSCIGIGGFHFKQFQSLLNMSQGEESLIQLIVYQPQVEVGGAFFRTVLQGF